MVPKVTPKGTHMMRQKNDGVMVLIFCQGWQLKHTHSTRTNAESPQAIVIQRLGDFSSVEYRIMIGVIRPSSRNLLQRKAFETFHGSSQIVVCALCQQLHQFPCGIHAIPCFPFGHRHIRVRWIAGFNIKLVYIRTVSEVTFQRCPCRSCLSAQEYKAMPVQQFACWQ